MANASEYVVQRCFGDGDGVVECGCASLHILNWEYRLECDECAEREDSALARAKRSRGIRSRKNVARPQSSEGESRIVLGKSRPRARGA